MKNLQRNKFYNRDKIIRHITIVVLDDPAGKIKKAR